MADVFDAIPNQEKVCSYLRSCVSSGRASHAYLFCGPAGSGKAAVATAFAQALLCGKDGVIPTLDEGGECRMVARKTHPDVHWLAPEGAAGYVVEQIREVIADFSTAPFRSSRKVYVIQRADQLGTACANALLKALEEPPECVVFVLLAPNRESVLPTISSRCQAVAFRPLTPEETAELLADRVKCSKQDAAIALSVCDGSLDKAEEFATTSARRDIRQRMVSALGKLASADDLGTLEMAQNVFAAAKIPVDAIEAAQKEQLERDAEFLQKAAVKSIETRNKRALTQAKLELFYLACSSARSWLRDAALMSSDESALVINQDCLSEIAQCSARVPLSRICKALTRVDVCQDSISYNVNPQICFEAMLFEIREVLYA